MRLHIIHTTKGAFELDITAPPATRHGLKHTNRITLNQSFIKMMRQKKMKLSLWRKALQKNNKLQFISDGCPPPPFVLWPLLCAATAYPQQKPLPAAVLHLNLSPSILPIYHSAEPWEILCFLKNLLLPKPGCSPRTPQCKGTRAAL
jgi:hypothetical protein